MKECIKCHAVKPIDAFVLCMYGKDGHLNSCKDCKNAARRAETKQRRSLLPPKPPKILPDKKICNVCSMEKPISDFVRQKRNSKWWYRANCKACAYKTYKTKYYPNDKRKLYNAQYWRNVKDLKKPIYTLTKTPIGFYDYDKLFINQRGVCAICGKPPGAKRLAVDHCHKTGRVRGLLCGLHNTMLGMAGDDPNILAAGITYLERGNQN